jgi:filamentous hemagglutinin family protein
MKMLMKSKTRQHARKAISCLLAFLIINGPVWAISNTSIKAMQNAGINTLTPGVLTKLNINDVRAIIDWNNMDTVANELLRFQLPGGSDLAANYAVLNRIAGDPTQFYGRLQGGMGHIIMINPKGITFGPSAVVEAGRFTASTMQIQMSNEEFLAGNDNFSFAKDGGDTAAQIALLAGSSVNAQRVDLLAQQIINQGTITTGKGGIVVMAAGQSVYLGETGSSVIVEMAGNESGWVTNAGVINAPEGSIVMASGDIYSTPLGMKVFDGSGTVTQNGVLNVDGTATGAGNGGTITLLGGKEVAIAANSITTADAIPDGLGVDRPDGGDIIIGSTEWVNIHPQANLSAKGNGWYDVDQNLRFDFGIDTNFSGSIQISGKYLNLPSPGDYTSPDKFTDHFDLLGHNVGPLQQLQSGILSIGNNEGNITIAEGAMPNSPLANTVYEEWIETVSYAGVHVDLLSAGNIVINDLNAGQAKDLGLIGGSGNMSLRTQFDNGGITLTDLADIIGTLDGGDVFMVAGSGGITVGEIDILNVDKTGNPGQIILATINGGDVNTGPLKVTSGNHEIVSISSGGDININGGIFVATNEVPDALDKSATADICIQAGDDITIKGPVEADSHGKGTVTTSIHFDAGLHPESNDTGESQAGIINVALGTNGQIFAKSEVSGPAPESSDLYSKATVRIHTSATGDEAINITGGAAGGSQAVFVRAKVQGQTPLQPSMPANDGTFYEEETSVKSKTQYVLVEIKSDFAVEQCDDCVSPPFLPPQPKFFLVKNDHATVDWRAGYTILGDKSYDPASIDVLLNDNGLDGQDNLIPLYDTMIVVDSLTTEKGGTLQWVQFEYIDGDGITHLYNGFLYTPPSYDVEFAWVEGQQYATFTDSFRYKGFNEASNSYSLNIAAVTITVQNEVPTLSGSSDSIHMNTSSTFDLSDLVIDNDGTPGQLIGDFTGTYGSLEYQKVDGKIPSSMAASAPRIRHSR